MTKLDAILKIIDGLNKEDFQTKDQEQVNDLKAVISLLKYGLRDEYNRLNNEIATIEGQILNRETMLKWEEGSGFFGAVKELAKRQKQK